MAPSPERISQAERRSRSEDALLEASAELVAERGVQGASLASIVRSWSSGRHGAKPKPQLPITTLVTPCHPDIVHHGSQKTWLS